MRTMLRSEVATFARDARAAAQARCFALVDAEDTEQRQIMLKQLPSVEKEGLGATDLLLVTLQQRMPSAVAKSHYLSVAFLHAFRPRGSDREFAF